MLVSSERIVELSNKIVLIERLIQEKMPIKSHMSLRKKTLALKKTKGKIIVLKHK